jgi:predicted peptidase
MNRAAAVMLVLAFAAALAARAAEQATGFFERTVLVGSTDLRYQVYLPPKFDPRRAWPVILFLHGAGERGTDGVRQTQVGLGNVVRTDPQRVPAVVVFPQAPPGTVWAGELAQAALAALDRTTAEFHGDPDRTYLTGISMGGYGVWVLAFDNPDRFAALVPVAGGIVPPYGRRLPSPVPGTLQAADPYAHTAARLKTVPAWAFHGADDATVPVTESRKIVDALRKAGADVRYTEYDGVGHHSWERAYAEPELWTWLFAQRRRGATGSR